MQTALIISASPLATDPRVRRHIDALKGHYAVTAAGFGSVKIDGVQTVEISGPPTDSSYARKLVKRSGLITRKFEWYYWRLQYVREAMRLLASKSFTVIVANDVQTLPLAVRLAESTGARLVFDAHEHASRQFEDMPLWKAFVGPYHAHILRQYLPKVDAMVAVSRGIAEAYRSEFGVDCHVLTNASPHASLSPTPVDPKRIRLVHHGAANPSRRLEVMVEAMDYVDERFTLDLLLVPSPVSYLRHLEKIAKRRANVRLLKPVALEQIVPTLNTYDVGVFTLAPVNFNYRHALPNKFFEFIQARLATAIGPSIEMAPYVHEYGFGVVAADFSAPALASVLNTLTPESVFEMKRRAHEAAPILSSDNNAQLLISLVRG